MQRQFNVALYERLALSRDKADVKKLSEKGQIIQTAQDTLKDPYVLEFLGLPEETKYSRVRIHSDPYSAMQSAHATAILTEWDEFKTYDWQKVYTEMLKPSFVFDGRNIVDKEQLSRIGFEYIGIGRR